MERLENHCWISRSTDVKMQPKGRFCRTNSSSLRRWVEGLPTGQYNNSVPKPCSIR